MDQQRFFRFLQHRIGLDVASVGAGMIERALRQRCSLINAQDLDDYWLRLQQSAQEQQALIEAVVVPETWFFRYPESFTALVWVARARLAELNGVRPLRLLSLPCSTGEEPYSISMALLDAGLPSTSFKIDAIDISPQSVKRARRAVYGRNSFRGSELDFRERHFTRLEEGLELHEVVRAQVRLQVGNVMAPTLLAGEAPYDFVFCRNLLIYFDVPTQQRVFDVLKGLTREKGVLFIGPAEGSLLARMGMRPLGIAQSFAFVRQTQTTTVPAAPFTPALVPPLPKPVVAVRTATEPALRARSSFRLALAEPLPVKASGNELLLQIATLANEGNSADAHKICEDYLKQHGPHAQVFYWLGLLNDVGGDELQAQGFYRKALYLEPQHPEALAHLAALLAARGDAAGARRLQERAMRSGQGKANG